MRSGQPKAARFYVFFAARYLQKYIVCGVLKCDPSRRAARAHFVFRADRRHHRRAAVLARIVPIVPESGEPRGRGSRGVPNRVGRCCNLSSPLFSRITRRGARQFPTTLKGSPHRGIVEIFSFACRRRCCPAPRRARRLNAPNRRNSNW